MELRLLSEATAGGWAELPVAFGGEEVLSIRRDST
jgi:hypothetical protein